MSVVTEAVDPFVIIGARWASCVRAVVGVAPVGAGFAVVVTIVTAFTVDLGLRSSGRRMIFKTPTIRVPQKNPGCYTFRTR